MKLILNSMTEGFNGLHTDTQGMSDFLNRFTSANLWRTSRSRVVRTENAEIFLGSHLDVVLTISSTIAGLYTNGLHDDMNGIDQFLGSAILQEIAGSPCLEHLDEKSPVCMHGKGRTRNPESSARIRLSLQSVQIRHAVSMMTKSGRSFSQLQRNQTVLGLTQNSMSGCSQGGPQTGLMILIVCHKFSLQYFFISLCHKS